MTLLCEGLSRRLAAEGAPHPTAAAITLAVRGLHGVDPGTFADLFGIDPDHLAQAESGTVPFEQLPPPVLRLAIDEPRLDLNRLGVTLE